MKHPIQTRPSSRFSIHNFRPRYRTLPDPTEPTGGRRFALPLLLLAAGLMLAQPVIGAPFAFSYTGSLSTTRSGYSATLLQSGKVLVAGGQDSSGVLASAELYDSAAGTWAATGSLNTGRRFHTATFLPNGKVLVAAGFDNTQTSMAWSAPGPQPGMIPLV